MDYSIKSGTEIMVYWHNAVAGLQYRVNDCNYRLFYLL